LLNGRRRRMPQWPRSTPPSPKRAAKEGQMGKTLKVVAQTNEPAKLTLGELATHINVLLGQAFDVREKLAKALYEARQRVEKETGENFYKWAARELHRPDGTPWKYWVLAKYVMWGKDPAKLKAHREQVARLGREQRAIAHFSDTLSVSDEVNVLMTLWERTSYEARQIFMQQVWEDAKRGRGEGKENGHG
jgi:hypothetical protein